MTYEKSDTVGNTVLLYDAGNGLGSGMSSSILDELSIMNPFSNISTVGIVLPHDNGINTLNNLLSLQYCIEYSSSILLRSYNELFPLINDTNEQFQTHIKSFIPNN